MMLKLLIHLINTLLCRRASGCLSFLLLFTLPFSLNAIEEKKQPLEIQSDSGDFDDKTGIATHRGNVIMTQGAKKLYADLLIIQRDDKGKIKAVKAYGKPAKFTMQPEKDKSLSSGHANTIEFYPTENTIILVENAQLKQNHNTINGPYLSYSFEKRSLNAPAGKGRTTVTIYPTEKE